MRLGLNSNFWRRAPAAGFEVVFGAFPMGTLSWGRFGMAVRISRRGLLLGCLFFGLLNLFASSLVSLIWAEASCPPFLVWQFPQTRDYGGLAEFLRGDGWRRSESTAAKSFRTRRHWFRADVVFSSTCGGVREQNSDLAFWNNFS